MLTCSSREPHPGLWKWVTRFFLPLVLLLLCVYTVGTEVHGGFTTIGDPFPMTGRWEPMDVRRAADLSPEAFFEEYVRRGVPVVIKGDETSVAAAALGWTPRRMARDCGDMTPNWARTVGAFVDGLDATQRREWDERLRRVHRSSLEELRETLNGRMTMREYVESAHFEGYRLDDFVPGKDFTHPVDYLVPVSVHSVAVADCRPLWDDLLRVFRSPSPHPGKDDVSKRRRSACQGGSYTCHPYATAVYDKHRDTQEGGSDFYLFVGPEKSRAYPTHRHGLPNYNLMLVLSGSKHVVVWPDQETPNLYPFPSDITPEENEVGEKPLGYMADAFDRDPTSAKQPDMRKITKSWEGVAGPGDLVFIPCGVPHAVQNRGEMLAVAWFASGYDMNGLKRPSGGDQDDAWRLKCPNRDNAVNYKCNMVVKQYGRTYQGRANDNVTTYACTTSAVAA